MSIIQQEEKTKKNKGRGRDKQCLRQKGQAVNKHRDILDAIHKVARYIDGFLLQSQNGCQIQYVQPGWRKCQEKAQVHVLIVYLESLWSSIVK